MTRVVTVTVTATVSVRVVATFLGLPDLYFQHHSTGRYLIAQGGCVADFIQHGLGYTLTSSDYNSIEIEVNGVGNSEFPRVPDDNTDYDHWDDMWGQTPGANWLGDALEHQVIMLKACYPNSYIDDDTELANDKTWIATVRNVADAYPGKLFIMLTQPPLTVLDAGGATIAARARELADWMVASLSDGRSNLVVFDLFDELADEDNYLHDGWETGEHDSHPTAAANAIVGPIFVDFVDAAIRAFV